ncbi:MAG TPA: GlsB/YeaQ/YmgE family stress response membrane protein [Saprospiraceae bacterium]|nr:GlsB/YeaQ/YmgE family stress response membrane protein [Saprospiraceae bacterium]
MWNDHNIIWILIVGAFIGWLAGQIMKGSGFGILMDIVIGIVGSWLGYWIFGMLGIGTGYGLIAHIITGVVGALVLLWLVSLISGRKS